MHSLLRSLHVRLRPQNGLKIALLASVRPNDVQIAPSRLLEFLPLRAFSFQHLRVSLADTRDRFEQLCQPPFDRRGVVFLPFFSRLRTRTILSLFFSFFFSSFLVVVVVVHRRSVVIQSQNLLHGQRAPVDPVDDFSLRPLRRGHRGVQFSHLRRDGSLQAFGEDVDGRRRRRRHSVSYRRYPFLLVSRIGNIFISLWAQVLKKSSKRSA